MSDTMSNYHIKVKTVGLATISLKDVDKVYSIDTDSSYKDVAALVLEDQQSGNLIEEFKKNFLIISDGKTRDWEEPICEKNILFFLPINGG